MAHAATVPASGSIAAFSSGLTSRTAFKAASVNVSAWGSQPKHSLVARAAGGDEVNTRAVTGVVFEPFTEVQSQLVKVPSAYSDSLARQRYCTSCEAAVNDQIK